MELHQDPEKRGKQVCYLLDPECTTEKAMQLYDSWGKYYDQVSSGGCRISQGWGRQPQRWGYDPIFPKNCMKMKKKLDPGASLEPHWIR